MLGRILKKEECAQCRFCCAFRRASQWETPIFTSENVAAIKDKTPLYSRGEGYYGYSLEHSYRTEDETEEAACPYLDTCRGCVLDDEQKPWDCKIWPLRVVQKADQSLWIVLTPTCPAVNKLDIEEVRSFVANDLANELAAYVKKYPALIKSPREDFFIDLVRI